jgi:protein involved in polysaccharide export with SLBB domain
MKMEHVIAALVVAVAGCTGSNRGKTGTVFTEGPSLAEVHAYNVTNDSPATKTSTNAESAEVIKPKDTLLVTFTNLPSVLTLPAFDQRVRDDGTITLIYNKVFQAAGKKTGDLENEVRDYYVPAYFTNLTVMVRLSCCNEFVYVDGDFRKPGRYAWTNGMRLKDAIDAAGGITEIGNHRIKMIREDGTVGTYRLWGDWAQTNNPALKAGDRIHNPRRILYQ